MKKFTTGKRVLSAERLKTLRLYGRDLAPANSQGGKENQHEKDGKRKENGRNHAPQCNHADFCVRYGLPTSAAACAVCTAERANPDTGAEFAQQMRNIGHFYGALACPHRSDTGETRPLTCCGGQVKDVPVYHCAIRNITPAPCQRCREKLMQNG
jgi:hypothetical protein